MKVVENLKKIFARTVPVHNKVYVAILEILKFHVFEVR